MVTTVLFGGAQVKEGMEDVTACNPGEGGQRQLMGKKER